MPGDNKTSTDDDKCEVCGLTVECEQCSLDAAISYGKISEATYLRASAALKRRQGEKP